jgi:hypothetical protein
MWRHKPEFGTLSSPCFIQIHCFEINCYCWALTIPRNYVINIISMHQAKVVKKPRKTRILCETGDITDYWLSNEVKTVYSVIWLCSKRSIVGNERAETLIREPQEKEVHGYPICKLYMAITTYRKNIQKYYQQMHENVLKSVYIYHYININLYVQWHPPCFGQLCRRLLYT